MKNVAKICPNFDLSFVEVKMNQIRYVTLKSRLIHN